MSSLPLDGAPLNGNEEPATGGELGPLGPVELLLGQGPADERAALRARSGEDPLLMLELADTVALFAQCRELRTEPSPAYALKLHALMNRAARRRTPTPAPVPLGRGLLWAAAAAVVTFALLWTCDPLGRRAHALPPRFGDALVQQSAGQAPGAGDPARAETAEQPAESQPARHSDELAWEATLELMRQRLGLESSPHLREALEEGLQAQGQQGAGDRLSRWLDPRNALTLMRLDHELRASAELRREALRRQGGLPAVDERVQHLASAIAHELPAVMAGSWPANRADRADRVTAVALAVRALIAAGGADAERDRQRTAAARWLAAQAPDLHGAALVEALAALVEVAAVSGEHFDVVVQQGQRLVDAVLRPDDQIWERSLPVLLGSRLPAATAGDAARLLRRLPGFGLTSDRCSLVRQLLLGQLRSRRAGGQDGPELLAALLFGCGDLLPDAERTEIELQLRRWKPVRLAPDYRTVQQVAWAVEPGQSGFTRLQGELRQLAVCPDPATLPSRAAFVLCLATNFAAYGHDTARLAGGF
jgi:hypothetical protein